MEIENRKESIYKHPIGILSQTEVPHIRARKKEKNKNMKLLNIWKHKNAAE